MCAKCVEAMRQEQIRKEIELAMLARQKMQSKKNSKKEGILKSEKIKYKNFKSNKSMINF